MTITTGDIKLVASQVMNDVAEGGGAPTSVEIVDGNSNSIFNDISELDRAGGRVNLRKVFPSVQTLTLDGYFGANIIVADPPEDPRVSVTLFSTESNFDRRTTAQARLEAYLAPSSEYPGYLFENHIAGQRVIQMFQRVTDEPPVVGKTLLLIDDEGLTSVKSQYVRVTRVSVVRRSFTYGAGGSFIDYDANIVSLDISDPLRFDLPGSPPARDFRRVSTATMIRDTVVADAASYYGVVPLTETVSIGDLSAKGESIFTQLVPSAQTEIPIIDANAAGEIDSPIDSANGNVTFTTLNSFSATTAVYVGLPIFPGTLTITYSGGTLTDNAGQLFSGGTVVGVIDYALGVITFAATSPTYSGSKSIVFRPAAYPTPVSDTDVISVTIESRSYNYVRFIEPIPAPGTLRVSFRAQGRWYTLRDNGAGILRGADAAFGSGTISYSTGNCVVTLGALPDVGSSILFSYGTPFTYNNRSTDTVQAPAVTLTLTHTGVRPGTVDIAWNDGTARTATDDGKGGISGGAIGTIDYAAGVIKMSPTVLPSGGQSYDVDYSYGPPKVDSLDGPWIPSGISAFAVSIALTQTPVLAGSVKLQWLARSGATDLQIVPGRLVSAYDDGLGVIKRTNDNVAIGTINYTTGAVEFETALAIPARKTIYAIGNLTIPGYPSTPGTARPIGSSNTTVFLNAKTGALNTTAEPAQPIVATYLSTAGSTGDDTITGGSTLSIDVTTGYAEPVVPGSIVFTMGGRRYFDKLGKLYYDQNLADDSAVEAGTINYSSGQIDVSSWAPGQSSAVSLIGLLTSLDQKPVVILAFRTPASPIRPLSLQILATLFNGGTINATADADGDFDTANVQGHVDYETGVVRLRFGTLVTAAGNEAEPWYSAGAVSGGQIFKPLPVIASSLRFNAVAFAYLPLDADILGLDPVRLPQDGRVPIFRPGTFAVLGHTGVVGPSTVTNGQVVNCGRVRLSRVRVLGEDNAVITTGYTADLEAGLITIDNITGWDQPVRFEHRIEDMVLVSDAQINGDLTFTRAITHNYPLGSYISSALVAGDLVARVSITYDQATWNSTFTDAQVGSSATGTFNTVLAPIEVTNKGALTERWAIQFTNTTSFNVIGENVGVITVGSTSVDCAPLNPATGAPYFTIRAAGWGFGWATGNVLRFNTVGALFPVWVVRTIQQGPETVEADSFTLLIRGDIDRP